MKRVLIIAHDFPPRGGAGAFRATKFARYLPEWDWQPVVITVADAGPRADPQLLAQLPGDLEVIRVAVPGRKIVSSQGTGPLAEPQGWRARVRPWIVPDPQITWAPSAIAAAQRRLQQGDIAALLTTAPPFSIHLSGWWLKRSHPQLPWLMDMRDVWSDGPWQHSLLLYKLNRVLEQYCLRLADHCTVVSEGIRRLTIRSLGAAPERITTLTNGYDPNDLPLMLRTPSANTEPLKDARPLTIRYVGSMVGLRAQATVGLFQALQQLVAEGVDATQLRVELIGAFGPVVHSGAAPFVAMGLLETIPPVAHNVALEYMAAADVLLLVLTDDWEGRVAHTTKFFEYLAVGRPIFAIAPEGEVTALLRDEQAGVSAAPSDVVGITNALRELLVQHGQGKLAGAQSNPDRFRRFQRRELTGQLARLLDLLVERQAGRL